MSKELEALKRIKEKADLEFFIPSDKEFEIIETALKENEEHKQILNDYGLSLANFRHACFTFAQFKNSKGFEGVEKKLKGFDIIKEKEVNVGYFIIYINKKENCYEWYKKDYEARFPSTKELLTQEEYDLLKEVLL